MTLTKFDLNSIDGLIRKRIAPLEKGQTSLLERVSGLENGQTRIETRLGKLEKGQKKLQRNLETVSHTLDTAHLKLVARVDSIENHLNIPASEL